MRNFFFTPSIHRQLHFTPVSITDKALFDEFTRKYGVYSDFNFNSFFSWNTEGQHEMCVHNNNLVLKFADYVTGEAFYSVLGTHRIDRTCNTLFRYAQQQGVSTVLKLVPEVTVQAIKEPEQYTIAEDPDNHDHIFSIKELSELVGNRFKSKRHLAQKCASTASIVLEECSETHNILGEIISLLKEWESTKIQQGKDVDMESEYTAITRMINSLHEQENLLLTLARQNGKLVGFSIDEFLSYRVVLSHYFKTLPYVTGLSEYLNREVARKLHQKGYRYWNWEQTLGIESLKRMKESYRPIAMQKKFNIAQVDK